MLFRQINLPRHYGLGLAFCLLASGLTFARASEERAPVLGSPKVIGRKLALTARANTGELLHMNFVLKSANKSKIAAFRSSQSDPKSPNFHKILTPDQFGKMFGATDADIKVVTDFATANGFKITHVWESRLFVAADVSVANAEKAFQVSIQTYVRPTLQVAQGEPATFFAPNQPLTAPKSVADRVEAVLGLDNALEMHPRVGRHQGGASQVPTPINPPTPPTAKPSFSSPMSPSDVSHFYGLDNFHAGGVNGDGQNIAIISPTSYSFQDNIDFGNNYGLSGWTVYWVNIDGGPTNFNGQLEACLDTEVIMGQAPHSTMWVIQFPNTLNNFVDAYNTVSSSSYNFIQVVSQSWGLDEATIHANGLDSVVSAYNTALSVMGSHGIAFYNSSGDAGGVPISPSTDPNATAVGGTENLVNNVDGTWNSEQGWNGSGGGNSRYFSKPSWQNGPGVSNFYSNGTRQVPDVSAAGGPTPGYYVRSQGGWYHVWGTSASCPLWAAGNLLLDQETNNLYGLTQWHSFSLNPELYWIGNNLNDYRSSLNGAFVFRDTTVGSTSFPTTDGWDYVTGWGSANFWKLWTDYVEYWGAPGYAPYDGRNGSMSLSGGTTAGYYDDLTTYSISASVGCGGPADMPNSTLNVQVDGVDHNFNLGSLPVGFFWPNNSVLSTSFTPGTHTINQILTVSTPHYTETTTLSSQTIQVNPALTSLSLAPNPVIGGTNVSGTVFLSSPAPAGGAVVSLSSANADATVPASFTIPAGFTSGSFTVTTLVSPAAVTGSITSSYNGTSTSASLTVNPLLPTTLVLAPSSVAGGTSVLGTVTLNSPAAAGGAVVTLGNTNVAASVPASFIIAGGATSGSFNISTSFVTAIKIGNITASYNGVTTVAKLTVNPLQAKSITLTPSSVAGGNNVIGKITLTGIAPPSGAVVPVTTTNPAASVPSSVTVAPGATFASFTITTTTVNATTAGLVSGTYGGKTASATLTVKLPTMLSLTVTPTSVYAGTTGTGKVTLTGPANTGGAVVTLVSGNVAVTVPASVTVPAGATSVTFIARTHDIAISTGVLVTGTYNATSAHGTLTVKPNKINKFVISPTTVKGGVSAIGTVTLLGIAAANETVTFTSTGGSTIPAPFAITVFAGHTTGTVTIHTTATAVSVAATVTATVLSSSLGAHLTATP